MLCGDIGALPNITDLQNRTDFSLSQLTNFVERYIALKCRETFGEIVVQYFFVISGVVGAISNFFMLASLNKSKLTVSGCTMIYHKAIILFEFPHMIICAQYGSLTLINRSLIPNSYSFVVWMDKFSVGWHIGDWAKLSISTLTAFLTLERFVAVCFPARFKKVNNNCVAYCAVIASIFVGSAHIWAIFAKEVNYDNQTRQFQSSDTRFNDNQFFSFTKDFIYIYKVVLSLVIFVLCIATAIALRKEARKVASMTSAAKSDLIAKRRICAFAYIIGVCTLIDHLVWVVSKVTSSYSVLTSVEDGIAIGQTYEQAIDRLAYLRLVIATGHIQAWTGQIVHGWKFFIYVALNKTIREGFKKVLRRGDTSNVVIPLH